jgi:AraC-like DNA-binding protein
MNIDVLPTVIYSNMMGMTIFALLLISKKRMHLQTKYLCGLLILLLFHIVGELIVFSGAYVYVPSLVGLQFPIRMLLGPALFLYASATMLPNIKPTMRTYGLALSGPLLVVLIMLPFALGFSAEEKLALADPATRNPEHFRIALMTCTAAMVMFILFTGGYLVAALRLHARHRIQLMERFSSIEKRSLDWFRVVLFLWGAAWLFYAVEYFLGFMRIQWFGTGIVLPIIEAIVLMVFAHLALKQKILSDNDKEKTPENTARSTALPEEKLTEIARQLQQVMEQDKLYLEDDLSLKRLSETLEVSENYISETLSQKLSTNFFHFVNRYRIEHAQHLLTTTQQSISTIMYEVGFNSKTTFNTAFKKNVGITPSAFRKQQ